jgi:inner membrane protein
MDSITQATLGGAVGEAVLGKKAGYRAAAWGVVLGTVPDLDILLNPFIDSVTEIRIHRGFTHSITFCLLASPFFGWMIDRFHKSLEVGWFGWTKLAFSAFLTHILIDIPTTYGTQALYPFTNTPYTTDSIFIIDPLYTGPLLIGLIAALFFKRSARARRMINYTGFFVSTMYMIWGLGIKSHVHGVFESSFKNQYGHYEMIKTTPNGPGTFLWSGYIMKNDTIYQSLYSIFDESDDLEFREIPRNTHLIEPYREDRALQTLLWFSRGYYSAEEENRELVFYDLRFGRRDLWLDDENTDFVWKNRIQFNDSGKACAFEILTPSFDTRSSVFSRFWKRIWEE